MGGTLSNAQQVAPPRMLRVSCRTADGRTNFVTLSVFWCGTATQTVHTVPRVVVTQELARPPLAASLGGLRWRWPRAATDADTTTVAHTTATTDAGRAKAAATTTAAGRRPRARTWGPGPLGRGAMPPDAPTMPSMPTASPSGARATAGCAAAGCAISPAGRRGPLGCGTMPPTVPTMPSMPTASSSGARDTAGCATPGCATPGCTARPPVAKSAISGR